MLANKRTNRRGAQKVGRVLSEPLEARRMLATFNGTNGNDSIFISASGTNTTVHINAVPFTTSDTQIVINGAGGNDTFGLTSTRAGTTIQINGGDGNDTLGNAGAVAATAYAATIIFDGGGGLGDEVTVNDTGGATTSSQISIDAERIVLNQSTTLVTYTHVERLRYFDSDGSNRISFRNMQMPFATISHLTIDGRGGNDTIANTSSAQSLIGLWATSVPTTSVEVFGGNGTDVLLLSNSSGTGGQCIFDVAAPGHSIDVETTGTNGPLKYQTFERIEFVSSSNNDTVHLIEKPTATSLSFDSGPGDDQFIVGGGDLDSNGWHLVTLVGGSGADSIIVNDELDTSDDGTSSTYTLASQSLTKGTQVINYSGFESQTVRSANGFVSGFNTVPVVNVNATASIMQSTTITGGAARGCTVNVGNGSFANLFGTFNVVLNGGFFDRLTASDATAGGIVNGYQVTDAFVRKSATNQTINYSGVSQMTVSTSTVFDSVAIDSTPAGMSLSVLTNGGNDLINFGGNIGANIRGPVSINGGAGTDSLTITNVLDNTPSTQTLTSSTFVDGNTLTYTACEQLTVNCGPGGTDLAVNSITVRTTINGGDGDDSFTVGGGDIDANLPISTSAAPALVVNGGGGIDSIRFDDFNGPNVDGYIFQRTNGIDQLDKTDAGIHRWVSWGGVETVTLDASNAPTPGTAMSGIVVSDIATQLRINGNGGNDWVQIFDAQQPITVNTGLGGTDRMDVNFDFDAQPLTVIVDQDDDIETLNVHAPAVLRITDDAVLTKTRLAASPANPNINGVLDLFGGAFLSRAGGPTLTQFRNQIITGRNGGTWDGTGPGGAITSSLASLTPAADGVGYGLGSQIAPTTIGPFAINAGDTLVRYTLEGDADLDQQVNLADFNRLASNFGLTGRVWTDGDSNYDGSVNLTDFNALAGNFGQAVAAPDMFGQQRIRDISDSDDRREILDELV